MNESARKAKNSYYIPSQDHLDQDFPRLGLGALISTKNTPVRIYLPGKDPKVIRAEEEYTLQLIDTDVLVQHRFLEGPPLGERINGEGRFKIGDFTTYYLVRVKIIEGPFKVFVGENFSLALTSDRYYNLEGCIQFTQAVPSEPPVVGLVQFQADSHWFTAEEPDKVV